MILGLDTSTDHLSMALKKKDGTIFSFHEKQAKRHGEVVIPCLEKMLHQAEEPMQSITGVVVGLGPGSFTGVRVGMASALGLAQALSIPIAGLSSYTAIAACHIGWQVIVVGDARREMLYAAGYDCQSDRMISIFKETLMEIKTLINFLPAGPVILSGPDADLFYDPLHAEKDDLLLAEKKDHMPQAGYLITLAEPILQKGGMDLETIEPIYLRKTQAEEMASKK